MEDVVTINGERYVRESTIPFNDKINLNGVDYVKKEEEFIEVYWYVLKYKNGGYIKDCGKQRYNGALRTFTSAVELNEATMFWDKDAALNFKNMNLSDKSWEVELYKLGVNRVF